MQDSWDQYLENALKEYNSKYSLPGETRQLYDEETEPEGIEFSQGGGAYEHNLGGVNYIENAVTPYETITHKVDPYLYLQYEDKRVICPGTDWG